MGTFFVVLLLLFAIRSIDCQQADDTTQCNPKDLTSHQLDQMNAREQEALVNNQSFFPGADSLVRLELEFTG